jgi:LysM repeat protein
MRSGIKKSKSKILESKRRASRRDSLNRYNVKPAKRKSDAVECAVLSAFAGGCATVVPSSAVDSGRYSPLTFQRGERRLPDKSTSGKVLAPMKLTAVFCAALVSALGAAFAQTPAPESAKPADAAQLEALSKKIDEQNAKIDALSQEILKLEQQVAHIRPGIMIGENTPSPGTSAAPAMLPSHPAAAGNTHIVARGETLTSIAKMYKVTVDELQQANHIEDGRKLQAGQTIVIPTASPAAAGSSTPTP